MSHFYGWTYEHLKSLDVDTFEQYWLAITTIEAQNILNLIDVEVFRHLKTSDRDKLHRSLTEKAYPDSFAEPVQLTNAGLANLLRGK
jgi:hypothetical protein